MISYSASLKAVGAARTGVAPVNLLDIQDVNGNCYFLSDRRIVAPTGLTFNGVITAAPPASIPAGTGVG